MDKFNYSLDIVLNPLSIGQVSKCILEELYKMEHEPNIFLISNNFDLSSEGTVDNDFAKWIKSCISKANSNYSRKDPSLKIWHINGSQASVSDNQFLFSFHEVSSATEDEINICKNQKKVIFSNQESCDTFSSKGVNTKYIPLGFDSSNFNNVNKKFFSDDRITFGLAGKLEKRKNHILAIDSWVKRFGNQKEYFLNCALNNQFLTQKDHDTLKDKYKSYFNVQLNDRFPLNKQYNDFLNSIDIMLCPSGGEGWGLPEFQATALGAHAVVLNCSGYKGWANKDNSVLIEPSIKINSEDGKFFVKGSPFNQGEFCSFSPEEMIEGCEKALKRYENNRVNPEGLELQSDFTYKKTAEQCINTLKEL